MSNRAWAITYYATALILMITGFLVVVVVR